MRPNDDSPCWDGEWTPVPPLVDMWAHSALLRTVAALPTLHPWRLGDDKGSHRSLVWSGVPAAAADQLGDAGQGLAVLTQTAPPPKLPLGDVGVDGELLGGATLRASTSMTGALLSTLASGLSRATADALADSFHHQAADTAGSGVDFARPETKSFRMPGAGVHRWIGGMARLSGAWLPNLAILPRSRRDLDDPATRWDTESDAFARRHTVHTGDIRFASDVLAPHVTALILDHVPDDAAVTVSGDAIHVWWAYNESSRMAVARARRTVEVAQRIRDAVPSFLLADHPDRSQVVQDRLEGEAARAAAYRSARAAGAKPHR